MSLRRRSGDIWNSKRRCNMKRGLLVVNQRSSHLIISHGHKPRPEIGASRVKDGTIVLRSACIITYL